MLIRAFFLVALAVFALQSHAASSVNDPTVWNYLKYQKQYALLERMRTIFPTNPSGTEWVIPSTQTLSNAPGGGVNITNSASVPVGGKTVPISTVKNASNAALAVAAGGVLRNAARIGVPAVGALMTAVAIKDLYDSAGVYFDPALSTNTHPLYKKHLDSGVYVSQGYRFSNGNGKWFDSPLQACMQYTGPSFSDYSVSFTSSQAFCSFKKNGQPYFYSALDRSSGGSCPVGSFILPNFQCVETAEDKKPLTPEEIDDLIAQQQIKTDALQELINKDKEHAAKNGVNPFGYQSPTLQTSQPVASGPSSIPGSSSTTTSQTSVSQGTTQPTAPGTPGAQPATQTTTTTTVNNITYNQNTVTNNIVNTTTTTITNNVTNETSSPTTETETTDKPEPEQEDPPVDTPFGPLPSLYERKYPDGLVGIWNQKSEIIKQSSAFTLASDLMPTALTAGTCPSWNINLDFTWWSSYGEHNVAPPCWIWDVAKGIIIISALMLARSLIFGG